MSRRLGLAAYRIAFVGVCSALCLGVFWRFVRDPGINVYSRAMFADVVYGTAHKPYVLRALLPWTVRGVVAALPAPARARLTEAMAANLQVQGFLRRGQWERELLPEYAVALLLMFGALVGFVFALRWLYDGLFPPSRFRRDLATLLALLGLPPCFYYASYLSDFPGLLLWTLALGLLVRERWGALLLVYAVGCLNKETFILLHGIFGLRYLWSPERMPRRRFFALAAAQVGLFVTIKGLLTWIYRENPGVSFEVHLFDHTLTLGEHLARRNAPWELAAWVGGALLAFGRWRSMPLFLKQAVAVLPVLVGLTAVFGFLDELRDYYEAFPVLVLMLTHTLTGPARTGPTSHLLPRGQMADGGPVEPVLSSRAG